MILVVGSTRVSLLYRSVLIPRNWLPDLLRGSDPRMSVETKAKGQLGENISSLLANGILFPFWNNLCKTNLYCNRLQPCYVNESLSRELCIWRLPE